MPASTKLACFGLGLFAVVAAGGCGKDDGAPPTHDDAILPAGDPRYYDAAPPAICKPPATPSSPWYTEVTAEVGLGGGAVIPLGAGVVMRDLDGDGFPDFFTSSGAATRDKPGAPQTKFLFMNRPAPSGNGRIFVDATAESGILATRDGAGGRVIGSVYPGDIDNDGDIDLIVCNGYVNTTTQLDACDAFLNDGTAHFTMAPESGLDKEGPFWPTGGGMFDFDRDGLLDFVPGTMAHWPNDPNVPDVGPKLFKGAGDGTFVNVAKRTGLLRPDGEAKTNTNWPTAMNAVICDIDNDGDDDLLFASYGRQYNQVFINDGGTFKENAIALGIAADDRTDPSDDESYRCYCDMHAGKCPAGVPPHDASIACPNRGWARGVSDQPESLGGNNFGFACGDLDNDGDMDLMTATIRHGDVGSASDPSELLINDTANGSPLKKFRRPGNVATGIHREHTGIFWNEGDMAPFFLDFDLDGRKDIYLASSDYPTGVYATTTHGWMWQQKPDGTFTDVTDQASTGQVSIQGAVFVDIDGDGDLDLVAGSSTYRNTDAKGKPIPGAPQANTIHAYRNDVGQDSNAITIRLVGLGEGRSNKQGLGAMVRVTASGVTQMQEVTSASSVLVFGLGAACAIEKIEVRWPDSQSTLSSFEGVSANYAIDIIEGDSAVKYRKR